jgi:hypothetical protein
MRPFFVLVLSFLCTIAFSQNPAKITVRYISQENAKKLDALNDQDAGLIFYKEQKLRKVCTTTTEVDSFLQGANYALLQQKAIQLDIIYIVSITGQEQEYVLTWDANSQQYLH